MGGKIKTHSRLQDLMRLDRVYRWGVAEVSKPQSVAEHTFRVMVIADQVLRLVEQYHDWDLSRRAAIMEAAMTHDGAEARTGDLHGPFKHLLPPGDVRGVEIEMCPWLVQRPRSGTFGDAVVKVCDRLETLLYYRRWRIPGSDHELLVSMESALDEAVCSAGAGAEVLRKAAMNVMAELGGEQ